jgi:hypothetical protein
MIMPTLSRPASIRAPNAMESTLPLALMPQSAPDLAAFATVISVKYNRE